MSSFLSGRGWLFRNSWIIRRGMIEKGLLGYQVKDLYSLVDIGFRDGSFSHSSFSISSTVSRLSLCQSIKFFYINLLKKARGLILKESLKSKKKPQAKKYNFYFSKFGRLPKLLNNRSNVFSNWLGHLKKKGTWIFQTSTQASWDLKEQGALINLRKLFPQEHSLSKLFSQEHS